MPEINVETSLIKKNKAAFLTYPVPASNFIIRKIRTKIMDYNNINILHSLQQDELNEYCVFY